MICGIELFNESNNERLNHALHNNRHAHDHIGIHPDRKFRIRDARGVPDIYR